MIVDHDEEGESRLLSIDDSGLSELTPGSMAAVAGEIAVRKPDLILVNPGALSLEGDNLVRELNRASQFEPGYSWTPAQGEVPK
jgi:hypothetical protein